MKEQQLKQQIAAFIAQFHEIQDAAEAGDNETLKEALDRIGAHLTDVEDSLD